MTDTTPMRKRLLSAAKIAACESPHLCHEFGTNVSCHPCERVAEKVVDALLSVLETPTKAMVKSGDSPLGYTMDGYPQPHTSADVWVAMVKAIRGGA